MKKINILECEVWEIKWVADGGNPWGGNPPPWPGRSYLGTQFNHFYIKTADVDF